MTLREVMEALEAIVASRGPEALDAPVMILPDPVEVKEIEEVEIDEVILQWKGVQEVILLS